MTVSIAVYSDYKSPYAYLAKDPAYELERDFDVRLDWRPFVLDIPAYLGSAEVGAAGEVLRESRNAHQWRRVRYSYMDVRRAANRRGLTILGTRKIFDSTIAAIGMLYAQRAGTFRRYHDITFERFWRRELDIESPEVVGAVLAESGADIAGWPAFLAGEGHAERQRLQREAEESGVFGVPSLVIDGELYWGREHLANIREMLTAAGHAKRTG
ncbi:DsbA family protein [Desertibaculum subflavum]|uniref:DsbA family protein n=1 Tax=Desertibaculum subflavum TaxID=2268458 RepID=UPI000E667252